MQIRIMQARTHQVFRSGLGVAVIRTLLKSLDEIGGQFGLGRQAVPNHSSQLLDQLHAVSVVAHGAALSPTRSRNTPEPAARLSPEGGYAAHEPVIVSGAPTRSSLTWMSISVASGPVRDPVKSPLPVVP